uniref:Uncharacterized protein n=1 Tax=Parascaris univalens TaxID=6257 RepID=A0A915BFM0_PARUN
MGKHDVRRGFVGSAPVAAQLGAEFFELCKVWYHCCTRGDTGEDSRMWTEHFGITVIHFFLNKSRVHVHGTVRAHVPRKSRLSETGVSHINPHTIALLSKIADKQVADMLWLLEQQCMCANMRVVVRQSPSHTVIARLQASRDLAPSNFYDRRESGSGMYMATWRVQGMETAVSRARSCRVLRAEISRRCSWLQSSRDSADKMIKDWQCLLVGVDAGCSDAGVLFVGAGAVGNCRNCVCEVDRSDLLAGQGCYVLRAVGDRPLVLNAFLQGRLTGRYWTMGLSEPLMVRYVR